MKRERFHLDRICSSQDYKQSVELRRQYLKRFHEENLEEIERITASIKVTTSVKVIYKKAYIKVFGELIQITIEEAEMLKETTVIIYK